MFSRPNADIEKMLQRLPRVPTSSQIDRMHKVTDIKERMYDLTDKERFQNVLTEFQYFAKKVLPQLKVMKKTLENFRGLKSSAIANNKLLVNLLDKYEELNLTTYVEGKNDKLVIGDSNNRELKD